MRAAGIVSAWLAATSLLLATALADAEVILKPFGSTLPSGLTVAQFAADATLKAPIESLRPEQAWPVTALGVSLNADTGLCADKTIDQILDSADADAAGGDGPDCIFGALLKIEAGARRFEIATECGDWAEDTASCWGHGQTGEFKLVREGRKAGSGMRLVFSAPPKVAGSGGGDATDAAAQKYGLFLDTLLDDKKQARGDLWLIWTTATVEIAFTR